MSTALASSLGSIYGSLYFAAVLSTAFYGVTCMQTFFYYVHYQNDALRKKAFVATVWALNTVHEALSVTGVYKFILAGLANPSSLAVGNPELILLYLFTALVAVATQGFFVHRIYLFSGRNIIAPLVWVFLALVQIVCTSVYVGKALYSQNGSVQVVQSSVLNTTSYQILATLYLSVAAGVDVLIAICMTFLLFRERSITTFTTTAHVLQRLTVFSVNTGLWTATFALLSIIFLHLFPSSLVYSVFTIPLCSVYCNALLANLNARAYFGVEATSHHVDTPLSMFRPSSRASEGPNSDVQRGEAKLTSPSHTKIWQTVEVLQFRDTCRATAEDASMSEV